MRKSKNNKDQLLIFFNLDTKNCLRLNDYEKEFSHNLLDGRKEIKYLNPGETICLSNNQEWTKKLITVLKFIFFAIIH